MLQSIFAGVLTIWSSVFLLPKYTVQVVESIFSRFLWSGCYDSKKLAFIPRDKVCQSLQNGGLGIKGVLAWNKSLRTKWIWKFLNSESLFTKWAEAYLLHNVGILCVVSHGGDAWGRTMTLTLRD